MLLSRVMVGSVLAALVVSPWRVAAQQRSALELEGWATAAPTWDRNEAPPVSSRALGVAWGLEGGAAWRRLALRLGFERGPLQPDGTVVDRDRIEGFALVGVTPIPAISVYFGPHARALVVDQVTERWLWWEVRGRAIVPIVKRRLDAYADGWSAVSGSVAPSQAFGSARGGSVGLVIRFAPTLFGVRVGYGIDQVTGGTAGRRETIEGLKIAFGVVSRD
jgi:hypothetical protein